MATIRERNGSYQISVFVGKAMDGRQIRKTMTYKPKATTSKKIEKEVAKAAADFEEAVLSGKYYDAEKITFEEFTENNWRPDWAQENLTLSQQEKYYFYIERYGYPTLQTMKINQIRPDHIKSILREQKQRLSPQSVKHIYTAINSVFKYAFDDEKINVNPCLKAKSILPRIEKDDKLHYFTRDQAVAFLDSILEPQIRPHRAHTRTDDTGKAYSVPVYTSIHEEQYQFLVLFNLALYGGFRRGELVAMQWQDVDFKRNTVSVRRAFAKTKSGQILKAPKTKSSARTITMTSESMGLLKEWKKRQQQICLQLGSQWQGKRGKDYDENFIFIQIDSGKAMYLDTPSQKFPKLIKKYNDSIDEKIKKASSEAEADKLQADKLPEIRFHDLRHTAATLLIANGVDIETIAKRLGHSQVQQTLNRYGHALPENDVKAAEALERIFAR